MIRFLTRHIRAVPCTVQNLIATKAMIRSLLVLCASLAGACVLALEAWAIAHLIFSF